MIWTVVYWVLLILAIGVGLRLLFWDRAGFRGRAKLRCRRCWYDLTASPGDLCVEPIQCPECGKKHASRRAMRKTRRSKRWVLVALLLWVGAYSVSVAPNIQKNGWSKGLPRFFIVATMPFLSEEQGTGIYVSFIKLGVQPTQFDIFILDQMPPEHQWAFPGQSKEEFGYFSRRLAFLLARIESEKP